MREPKGPGISFSFPTSIVVRFPTARPCIGSDAKILRGRRAGWAWTYRDSMRFMHFLREGRKPAAGWAIRSSRSSWRSNPFSNRLTRRKRLEENPGGFFFSIAISPKLHELSPRDRIRTRARDADGGSGACHIASHHAGL